MEKEASDVHHGVAIAGHDRPIYPDGISNIDLLIGGFLRVFALH
jgi:hypothetical protein